MHPSRLLFPLIMLSLVVLAGAAPAAALSITDYSMSPSSGTFTPLTGATFPPRSGGSLDDGYYNGIPIGFNFNFNDSIYTTLAATTNGAIFLGATLTSSVLSNNLTSGTPRPVIAPLWDDLELDSVGGGSLSYKLEGAPGSQVFTLQWKGMFWNYTATTQVISFQVKLFESGRIEFIYRDEGNPIVGTATASIGLAGVPTGPGNFLSLSDAGTSPTVSYTSETTSINAKPATGQTYAFTRAPMTYVSSDVTQNTTAVSQGALNAQIIGIQVVTDGGLNPLAATSFTLNTTGTTNTADIVSATLYYTGTSSTFQPINPFGSTVTSPSGTYTITGSRTLAGGTNYFWLAYDVSLTAGVGNQLDAGCTSLIVDGISRTPTTTAPAGSRQIQAAMSGTYTIDPGGGGGTNYTTFTAAVADLNTLGISGPVTFNVKAGVVFAGPIDITATGTPTRPIIFQRSGAGANPILQAPGTTSTTEAVVTLRGSDYITFDGIDVRSTPDSTLMEWGFYLLGAALDGCKGNTVKNCVITMNRGNTDARGVYLSSLATDPSGANSNNRFYNNQIFDARAGYWLNGVTAAPDSGNEIGTTGGGSALIRLRSGAVSVLSYGVYYGFQTSFKVFDLVIDSISTASSTIGGIYNSGGAPNTVEIYDNVIRDLSSASGTIYGIYGGFTGVTYAIHNNEVTGFTTSATSLYGIYNGGGVVNVYKNRVHNLSYTGASTSIVYGIYTGGGTTQNIYNNFIYDLRGPGGTTSTGTVNGIYVSSGTTINLYYNTVLLDYVATAASNQCNALYVSSTPTAVDMRNNIFVNNADVTTGTRAVAFRKGSTTLTNIAATTNYNLYYAGTPSSKNLIFWDGTNRDSTLADYKARMVTRDQAAITENPPFVSAAAPYDLHIQTTVLTQIESGGSPITTPIAVADDFDGNARNASTPDVGADEFNGIGLDLNPPVISYAPLGNTGTAGARTLNTSITDASGVPTAGIGLPVLYWKINSGSWSPATASYISGSQYNFSLGAGAVTADTVFYYIVAQDGQTTPIIGSSPAGATGLTANPPAAATPPPVLNSYVLLTVISAFPYLEDFEDTPESGGLGWSSAILTGTVNDWVRGTPAKTFITRAHGGLKAYVTKETGNYSDNHNAYVLSPLLNFTGMASDPVVDFYHNFFTERSYDGAVLEYSTNGGSTWRRADSVRGTPPTWNTLISTAWYNNDVFSGPLAPPKWSDTSAVKYPGADSGWIRSTTVLPGCAGLNDVALRWRFQTDGSVNRNGGWAIDDVSIYEGTGGVNLAVNVAAGWNMISNPVTTVNDSVRQLFPTSSFPYVFAFAGAGGYQQRYIMENGLGYWGKFPNATTATISGQPISLDTVAVLVGWNMVGSISTPVDTPITSIPPGIQTSGWYEFAGGYNEVGTLTPGKGYWVKASSAGSFVLAAGPAPEKSRTPAVSVTETMNSLTIVDAAGNAQTLWFGTGGQEFEMPPAPPEGVFDVRFETPQGGAILKGHEVGASMPVSIRSAAAPLTVTWNIRSGAYTLDGGQGLTPLSGEGKLAISAPVSRLILRSTGGPEIPADYVLMQNYPNPFNPSTTIRFGLPAASRVRVEVYNLLGQRVGTLVNNIVMEAGYQSVEWNGTGADGRLLGSGVYFVRLNAEGPEGKSFTDLRKMMLMK